MLSKCEVWLQKEGFLGHTVCKEGIRVDPKKVEAVVHQPRSTNVIEIKIFLGFGWLLQKVYSRLF